MIFDLDQRRARMSVGDLSDFAIGPRGSAGGGGGLWRAQLGTRWHQELRAQAVADGADADFEVTVEGELARRGWVVSLSGRIDQVVRSGEGTLLREMKTVSRALPASEDDLRADYPDYFVQVAAYAALRGRRRADASSSSSRPTAASRRRWPSPGRTSGFWTSAWTASREFLDLRLRARRAAARAAVPAGVRGPAARARWRPRRELRDAVRSGQSAVLLEAPTGFGKTGVLLECALGELREGSFDRVLYVTGKSTGPAPGRWRPCAR